MTNAPHAAKNSSAQAKEAFEKMNVATADAAALIKNSYSTVVKGAQDYNNKVIEFAQANTVAAFDFAQKLSGVKSPSDFMELSTEHSRFETLTEQTKGLRRQLEGHARGDLSTGVSKSESPGWPALLLSFFQVGPQTSASWVAQTVAETNSWPRWLVA
jgi:phasin